MQTALLEQALKMPDAYVFIDRLQAALELEKVTRQHFYEIVDENKKMEFINGEIFFHSPVKLWHNRATGYLYQMLDAYTRRQKLGHVGFEKLLISLTRNDYEPDVCFWGTEKSQEFKPDQMQFPAPDFVAEVLSNSTAANDRGIKYQDYESHGVQEYWIIDPDRQILEQYVLDGDLYELRLKAGDGIVKSNVIAGFTIPINAIFDEEANAAALTKLWLPD